MHYRDFCHANFSQKTLNSKYIKRLFSQLWTPTLREEKRLQVFENKVVRKIFGPKRDDQTDKWRRLHNGELHDLYGKPDIMRIVKSRRL